MTVSAEPDSVQPAAKPVSKVGVGTHYLRYGSANVLVMIAGFISFPVLTRMLDNTEYGILGYYETWVMMAVALAKLGAQHAIIRFYPFGGDHARHLRFSTNLFLLPMLAWRGRALLLLNRHGTSQFVGLPVTPGVGSGTFL